MVKPLFSDKIQTPGNFTLPQGDELVSDDKRVAEILNDYFVNITASLENFVVAKLLWHKN